MCIRDRPSTTKYQPDINQYRPIMTQYHPKSTSTAFYWPSTTKYQPVPPPTDPLPPSTNRYRLLPTQCQHISTSTASYWPSTTKYQPVPTYTVFSWGLQTPAQFTPVLVSLLFVQSKMFQSLLDHHWGGSNSSECFGYSAINIKIKFNSGVG